MVGYTTDATSDNYNFVTIPFAQVGYNTSDIQQIALSDNDAGVIGYGTENFSVWSGLPTVMSGSEFFLWAPDMDPSGEATACYWGDADQVKTAFSVAAGQAVVINCAADLVKQVAGSVPATDIKLTSVEGYNFIGNPFPVDLSIQNIKVSDDNAGVIGYGTENFSVWAGLPTVVSGTEFFLWAPDMDPTGEATECYWGDADQIATDYVLPVGQGAVISCNEGLKVTIKPPFSL